ncbi:MAG: Na+/H+ antiporter NhaC family protein [Candidatus Neomarinimicrobiota bacterium]
MSRRNKAVFLFTLLFLLVGWEVLIPGRVQLSEPGPSITSLLPPLIAITMALITREVILSLFSGVWIGATILAGYRPFQGLATALDTYLVESLADMSHSAIILFSLGFGGIIGVIGANGGMKGIVQKASQYARTARSSQIATMLMGILIFFDDYANTLLVGNMMRPFTDRLKVSREKLAYLVDSTAAPVASLALISTWSVFQMSLLEEPYREFGITGSPYITFLQSIPYSFYCILTLIFMFLLLWSRRDYGQMFQAERRARVEGKVLADDARPLANTELFDSEDLKVKESHWSDAMIPIATVIAVTLLGLYITGKRGLAPEDELNLRNIIGASNSYASLMWGSFTAGFTAIVVSVARGVLSLRESIESWLTGVRSMVLACIVLVLAWSLGKICGDVHTADYIVNMTGTFLSPFLLPAVTFITAALISFSTGTSWGTMSILVPIIVPMQLRMVGGDPNMIIGQPLFLATFASVLSGAVFGDHCSPISDTTILSSTASGSDHIDHVKTQLPYAITTAVISVLAGYLLVGLGVPWIVMAVTGVGAVVGAVWLLGKRQEAED